VEEKNNLGTTDDLELIAAINEGDEAAFEALYYRHRDWVVNLAHRWTEDRELAFDVLQETFFYFARKFPGFRLTGKLQTFLFPVVRNLSLTALRKSKRYRTGDEGNQLEEMPAAAQEAGGAEQLGAVVASLPVEQRDVLLLRFVDDLSLEEISETLGIPPGTVKSRLHNALEALRKSPRTKKYFGL
jgi:RNA polymerase sigma-70 factor (ECF subfamily)